LLCHEDTKGSSELFGYKLYKYTNFKMYIIGLVYKWYYVDITCAHGGGSLVGSDWDKNTLGVFNGFFAYLFLGIRKCKIRLKI